MNQWIHFKQLFWIVRQEVTHSHDEQFYSTHPSPLSYTEFHGELFIERFVKDDHTSYPSHNDSSYFTEIEGHFFIDESLFNTTVLSILGTNHQYFPSRRSEQLAKKLSNSHYDSSRSPLSTMFSIFKCNIWKVITRGKVPRGKRVHHWGKLPWLLLSIL